MKKAFYKKWWFWVIVVLVIGAIGSAGETDEVNERSTQTEQSVVETVTSAPKEENTEPAQNEQVEEPNVESAKTTYSVGDTAVAKSYKITVESLEVIESDNQFAQPDEGNEFVEVSLLIENLSEVELIVSSVYFDAYVDDFTINEDLSARVASKQESMNGTVGSGKKIKGSLCYQVPENWTELEIKVDLGYSSKNEIILLFNNQ